VTYNSDTVSPTLCVVPRNSNSIPAQRSPLSDCASNYHNNAYRNDSVAFLDRALAVLGDSSKLNGGHGRCSSAKTYSIEHGTRIANNKMRQHTNEPRG
jgi:hypothetical protein